MKKNCQESQMNQKMKGKNNVLRHQGTRMNWRKTQRFYSGIPQKQLEIGKWTNSQLNSQQNDEIPTKIPTICDNLPLYISPSSVSFLPLLLPHSPIQKEEEVVYMGAKKT